jgi:trans-aconitate 2-methyltransferase
LNKNDWNPDHYLQFDTQRTQPSIDLASHIHIEKPANIIDIGCGPGNSTHILFQRWPDAHITGIDNSAAMIEKAKTDYPGMDWRLLDAAKDRIEGKYDIVFSNAAIQWMPDHSALLKKFHDLLSDKGVIAVQVPLFWKMPLGRAISGLAEGVRWGSVLKGTSERFTFHDYSYYYDLLSPLCETIEIWETDYIHILDSRLSILEMISSTGLRPYLDRLKSDTDKEDFKTLVLDEIAKDYPLLKDGKVLFPFKRLFFIATK